MLKIKTIQYICMMKFTSFGQGLQYVMFEKENKAQPSFVVISNGAEVVQISRSLFISKLDFNARERLRSEV